MSSGRRGGRATRALLLAGTLAIVFAGFQPLARAQSDLAPGAVIRLAFPDLPPTFFAQRHDLDTETAVLVRLPANYSPERSFPLFVYLDGSYGGNGSTHPT